jgi:hypothetical protein
VYASVGGRIHIAQFHHTEKSAQGSLNKPLSQANHVGANQLANMTGKSFLHVRTTMDPDAGADGGGRFGCESLSSWRLFGVQ